MSMESVVRKIDSFSVRQMICLILALQMLMLGLPTPASANGKGGQAGNSSSASNRTRTPIKHVIVIIGENRSFDHLFATYKPKGDQFIWNLRSEGIVKKDGTPGPNYSLAAQFTAIDESPSTYQESPMGKSLFEFLSVPLTGGPTVPLFTTVAQAKQYENGLAPGYYKFLTTGGTGLPGNVPDTRISYLGEGPTSLPDGPFQLTPGVSYDSYAASPVHRFYQMWQQEDCNAAYATKWNPSGCQADLFPWVELTIGAGSNGNAPGSPAYDAPGGEGATSMGFYNMAEGDVPYFKYLADHYAFSDNYHQAAMGGTGANHIMMGTGYDLWFTDGHGHAIAPPTNQIENPNPLEGTNNWYTQDGYSGGSYSECSDPSQPGVGPIEAYLASLARPIDPDCLPGDYYILNNYNPGYYGNGTVAYGDPKGTPFTVPPSNIPTIGDVLLAHHISWKYYGDGWNNYVANPYNPNNTYCNICNFEQYVSSIMTNPSVRTAHLQDTANLYQDIQDGDLPAVSFVKPSGLVDGHPASSKFDLFEGFAKKIIDLVQANPSLWASTAIFVTVDEGGGYYDSGYVQPLDFFGDGTRIPLIVVSPYTDPGHISHEYADHVSILKFIEANWNLSTVTSMGRDNLPDPIATKKDPYVPENSPAISDLMDMFEFGHGHGDQDGQGGH